MTAVAAAQCKMDGDHYMANYNYTVLAPGYTIGDNAYDKIKEICPVYGRRIVAIGGHTAISKVKELILQAIAGTQLEISDFIWFGGETSYENVDKLKNMDCVRQADMIFAIGGGKAVDTAKVLAHTVSKPFFTFPTLASNCASFTSLGVVYHPSGVFRELSFSKVPPKHVFIYTPVIVTAPSQYLWAGMGDTIAKHYESAISSRGEALAHADLLGVTIGKLCCEPIMQYGGQALADNRRQVVSREFEEVVMAIVVTTGMVSNIVDHAFNAHIAHALFCTITVLPQIEKNHLHGEVVMYGVLVLLMCDNDMAALERAFHFCKSVGLPTKLADIEVSLAEMDKVLDETAKSHELDRTPYKVTKQMLYDAVTALEEYNKTK